VKALDLLKKKFGERSEVGYQQNLQKAPDPPSAGFAGNPRGGVRQNSALPNYPVTGLSSNQWNESRSISLPTSRAVNWRSATPVRR
jgi:hypothetical protein